MFREYQKPHFLIGHDHNKTEVSLVANTSFLFVVELAV